MFTFLLWCILFVFCWPLALLALIAYPFVWLLLLPFRIVGVAVHGVLEIIFVAITLPFRLLAARQLNYNRIPDRIVRTLRPLRSGSKSSTTDSATVLTPIVVGAA
jgi:uncharacterized membrane protein